MNTNDQMIPQIQIWVCERCRVVGSIPYQQDANLLEALDTNHWSVSAGCSRPATALRVTDPSLIASRANFDTDTTLPVWAKERLALLFFGPKMGDAVSVPAARCAEYYAGTVGTVASQVYFDPFDHTPVCLVRVPGYGPTIVFAVSDLHSKEKGIKL